MKIHVKVKCNTVCVKLLLIVGKHTEVHPSVAKDLNVGLVKIPIGLISRGAGSSGSGYYKDILNFCLYTTRVPSYGKYHGSTDNLNYERHHSTYCGAVTQVESC